MEDSIEKLLPQKIQNNLETNFIGKKIYYYDKVGSTNEVAKEFARHGEEEGTVVIAETQTEGRGRWGRFWYSPYGEGLWFSVILNTSDEQNTAQIFTLIYSLACLKAIEALTNLKVGIKWPNDLLIKGKKVAGILSELVTTTCSGRACSTVNGLITQDKKIILGIGLNVNVEAATLPAELREIATSIKEEQGYPISRIKLLQIILRELEKIYLDFTKYNDSFLEEFEERLM